MVASHSSAPCCRASPAIPPRSRPLGAGVGSEPDVDRVYVAFVIGFGLGFRERSLRQGPDLAFHPPDLLGTLTEGLSQQEQQAILIHQVLERAVASPHLARGGRGRGASPLRV